LAHDAQPDCSKLLGHRPHAGPYHWCPHVQLHPLVWSPLTAVAWLLQSTASVHLTPQLG
jgi:hypothetical protein